MNTDTVVGVVKYDYMLNGKKYSGNDIIYRTYKTKKDVDKLKSELVTQVGADSIEIKQLIYK